MRRPLASLALGAAALLSPPALSQDSLLASVYLAQLQPGGGGGGGLLEWTRAPGEGRLLVHAGLGGFTVERTRWFFGRAGAVVRPRPTSGLTGSLELGRGTSTGAGFLHLHARLGAFHHLIAGRLVLELEDQYLDVRDGNGNVLRAGLTGRLRPDLGVSLHGHLSTGGSLDIRSLAARVDLDLTDRASLFLGGSVGRVRPESGLPQGRASREAFAGASFPAGALRLTVLVDYLRLSGARRLTLGTTVRLAL